MLGLKLNHVSKRGSRGIAGLANDTPCGAWAVDELPAYDVIVQF